MAMTSNVGTLPADWALVLGGIQNHLSEAVDEIETRLQQFSSSKPIESSDYDEVVDHSLRRLEVLENLTSKSQALVANLDQVLETNEQQVRGYLERSAAIRQKLADWMTRAIR